MRRLLLAAVLAFAAPAVLVHAQAHAQAQAKAPAAVAPAKPKRELLILDAKAFDTALVVPKPPAEGSPAQAADLAELHRIEKARTPERLARAKWDGEHEDTTIYAAVIPGFDLKALPATARALETLENDQKVMAGLSKAYFKRPRPWVADPSLLGCERNLKKPLTSYPSGHATLGYSLAGVLENLMPEKAKAIRARADDYAYSRLVCLAHYPTDVEAGRVLGGWVAAQMLKSPAYRPQLEAARAELKAAGLTR
jgi:acid phosphatase (class A)